MLHPETRYASIGGDRVAYQVLGEGPSDLVFSLGQWGHVDVDWEEPAIARFFRRLASFSRLIRFDPRGSGLSDLRPQDGRGQWEHWIEDLLTVLDAVASHTAAIVGARDCGPMALQFAAAYPERVSALVLLSTVARYTAAPDYPQGFPPDVMKQFLAFTHKHYGSEKWARASTPSQAHDSRMLRWIAKWLRAAGAPKSVAESFENQLTMDARPALSRIRARTLVMRRRDHGWSTVAHSRYIADHIAGAHFLELPGADVDPFWETPDLILDHLEEFLTGTRLRGEPDRVLAAVLFTDIVGSTVQAANLGDAGWRALLDRHDHTLREQVGLFGGNLADHSGDGSLSIFENPRRAIECALALQKAIVDIGIEIRAGIHFGEIERRAEGASGVNVHIGARVMALAGAGEVLVSRTVRDILLGSRFEFRDGGVHELKGVPDRWAVFRVGGPM
jgi:class 3 adenylate cyclase